MHVINAIPFYFSADQLVCNNTAVSVNSLYELREGSSYCYRLFEVSYTFSAANRTCVRDNAFLTRIDSREENDYINNTYFGTRQQAFWIGLSDQDKEGAFRYVTIYPSNYVIKILI